VFGLSKRALVVIALLVIVVIIFLAQSNGSKDKSTAQTSSGGCQVKVTADVLNVRSDPTNTAKIVGKLTNGDVTGATKTVQNNFRQLGDSRWVAAQFVSPVSGSC
jgi:uncharacterized protein YgiM (DUF1202 family)